MRILLAILATLACASATLAAIPKNETEFRARFHLEQYPNISYHNSQDMDIGFDKFNGLLASGGKGFKKIDGVDASSIILKIVDIPAVQETLLKPGERLPTASLLGLDGRAVELHSRAGRPLLMNFFFDVCTPCIAETPALNEFAKLRRDIDVVAVTFDTPEQARAFVAKHGFTWTIVPNARPFINQMGVRKYPRFAYVDKAGKLLGIGGSPEISPGKRVTPDALDGWIRKLDGT